jgi:hypothetical protein
MVETIEPEGPQIREGAEEPAATPLEPTTNTAPANAPMQEAADKLIADYFQANVDSTFKSWEGGNWKDLTPFSDNPQEFGTLMASLVSCQPRNFADNVANVNYSVTGGRQEFIPYLVKAYGNFVLEIDLFKDEALLDDFTAISEHVPFLQKAKQLFTSNVTEGYSPLSFALSMERPYRDLFILALHKQLGDFDSEAPHQLTPQPIIDRIYVAGLPSLIEVCKEYQFTGLKPVLNEIERVYTLYKEAWDF